MKFPHRALRAALPLLLVVSLSSCDQWEGRINSLKNDIDRTRDANQSADVLLQDVKRKSSTLQQSVNNQKPHQEEIAAKAAKSAAAERVFVKYRSELEAAHKEFSKALTEYRAKYLAP